MVSYNDPIPDGDFTEKKRYNFTRGHCSWCGKLRWVAEEGMCGVCYEDPIRIQVEYSNAREARRNK